MSFFGFLGRLPPRVSPDLAVERVREFARLSDLGGLSPSTTDLSPLERRVTACAPQISQRDGLTVVFDGHLEMGTATNQPDSDVVLDLYRRHGSSVARHIDGRFALAIHDSVSERALLAVDRLGIERLTFATRGPLLVFSSSAKAVARFDGVKAAIDPQAIYDYLLLHMVPAPRTAFAGVSKLLAGTCAIFERGSIRTERYWEPRFASRRESPPFGELRSRLRTSLRAGVEAAAPDAETGAFLSGGLDSSAVAGTLNEVTPSGPAKTFSIGFGYEQYDERSYARIANAHFGCRGHEYVVDGNDIVETFPLIARSFDEPFGNSSALPVYYCARLAREHGVNHLLAGDGGDELFAGNSRYAEQQIFENYALVPRHARTLLESCLGAWPMRWDFVLSRKARGYIRRANTRLPARLESWNFLLQIGAREFLHPDFFANVDPEAPFRQMQDVWDAAGATSTLNRMLFYDWQYTLANNDLRKVQTMCSLAGVRVSYPMLHPSVLETALAIPDSVMMPGTRLRHFYKQAVRGWLPDTIIDKKKHGFGLPFGLWLKDSPRLADLIATNVNGMRSRRLLNPDVLDRLTNLHGSDDSSFYGVSVWVIAMLEQWFREHDTSPGI